MSLALNRWPVATWFDLWATWLVWHSTGPDWPPEILHTCSVAPRLSCISLWNFQFETWKQVTITVLKHKGLGFFSETAFNLSHFNLIQVIYCCLHWPGQSIHFQNLMMDSGTDSLSNSNIVLCRTCSHCTDSDSDPYSLFLCGTEIWDRIDIRIHLQQCKWPVTLPRRIRRTPASASSDEPSRTAEQSPTSGTRRSPASCGRTRPPAGALSPWWCPS